jgi:uncharacterized membrane protein
MIYWPTKKVVLVSISFCLAYIGIIGSNQLHVPLLIYFLRPVIGFICIILIPGILILRILKIENIDGIEYIFYLLGLSIAFTMFTVFLINILLPLLYIKKPITIWPTSITYILIIFLLCAICYIKDKDYRPYFTKDILFSFKDFISPVNIFLCLIPILTSLGSMIIPVYHNISVSVISIIFIISIMAMAAHNKLITQKTFYLVTYIIALSLLLHTTMASSYPMRINVDNEYYYQQLVLQNGCWNMTLSSTVNTTLSVVLLAPIFTLMLGFNSYIIFQVIYPVLFATVPVMLYHIYSRQIGPKYGLFSVFFFISLFYFYVEAPLLRRQEIASIFLVLLILLLIDEKIARSKKTILGIVLSLSLFVSHYATGYIFLGIFLSLWLIIFSINYFYRHKVFDYLKVVLGKLNIENKSINIIDDSFLTGYFIILNIVFALAWYMYVGSGSPFVSVAQLGNSIIKNITDFLNPSLQGGTVSALGIGFFSASLISKIYRVLQYGTQVLIIIGYVGSLYNKKRFNIKYLVLSGVSIIILFLFILLPFASLAISTVRMYFIVLIVISPYCVLGGECFCKWIISIIVKLRKEIIIYNETIFLNIFYIAFLVPYFAFNFGLVFLAMGFKQNDINIIPSSAVLSYNDIDSGYYTKQEVEAAQVLAQVVDQRNIVYADYYGYDLISAWHKNAEYTPSTLKINPDDYLFLRKWEIDKNQLIVSQGKDKLKYINQKDIPDSMNPLMTGNKIYTNGDAELYKG